MAGKGKLENVLVMDKWKFKHTTIKSISLMTKRSRTTTFSSTTDIIVRKQRKMSKNNHEIHIKDLVMRNYQSFSNKRPKKYRSMKIKILSLIYRAKLFLTLLV